MNKIINLITNFPKISGTFLAVIFLMLLNSNPIAAQVSEDFESGTASGWTTSGTASTGTFVVANPTLETTSGVTTQLEDDHTAAPGVNAYFTATNTSAGNADVDGGTSITTSPVYNITSTSQLSIWYFFGQRDNGDDAGDFFLLEYSLNGGTTYTNLVSIGDITINASWTEATAVIPAGSNVVIRVTVSDGSSTGDIVEGGIDDLTITTTSPAVTVEDVTVNEDAGTADFTVTHTGADAAGIFTVNYQTVNGTATSGSDFTFDSGTLNFNGTSGDTETISVPITDDGVFENTETFTIQFTATSDGSVDISDTATGSITDDDGLIITDGVTENTCGGTFLDSGGSTGAYSNFEDITYTICPDTPGSFTRVNFSSFNVESGFDFLFVYEGTTTGGTLIGTYDNSNPPTIITSTDGSGCLTFRFTSDFSVTLDGWEAVVSCFTPGPTMTIADVAVNENAGTANFTVTHTGASATGPFTVNFQTVDGTALAGSDYTSTSGTLSFNGTLGDTEVISVPITDDAIVESDETFTIQLTGSSDGTVDITDTATGTINSQISSDAPLTLFEELYGNVDYVVTGNTLRTADNGTDACAVTNSSSATLIAPIPGTATIRQAYLYWAHSSSVIDANVTFEGQAVTADIAYNAFGATYWSYLSDVTSIVTAASDPSTNTYDFADLTIDNTSTCGSQGVLGGWALIVFYDDPTLPAASINLYQGFQRLRNASDSFTLDSFYAIAGSGAKATFLSWEGDSTLSGASETLSITNEASTTFTLSGDGGQTGNNAYNSTIYDDTQAPVYNDATPYGLDLDTYGISSYISPGDSQVTANVSVANDAVFFNAVLIRVQSNLVTGTVFEDTNYPGGAGRDMASASGTGISNATLEIYDSSDVFIEDVTTDSSGDYTFGGMADGNYTIRVVNSTVRSNRGGGIGCTECIPVQTYRNFNTTGTTVDVTDEVGGASPSSVDAAAGTLTGAQSASAVTIAGNGVVGLDFGFNFNTIVNTNEDGQGSLEQFIVNTNNLDETGLDIESNSIFDPAAGEDTSIFMIPNSTDPLGRTADTNFGGNFADISISNGSPLTNITSDNTIIDGRTQRAYSGDTNSGTLGSGGTTVGISSNILPTYTLPEIQVHRDNGDVFVVEGSNTVIRNVAVYASSNAGIRIDSGSASIIGNLLGVNASGNNAGNIGYGLENQSGNATVDGNYIATNTDSGILIAGGTSNIIQNNHITANGNAACDDNITITGGSGIVIQRNLIENAASLGIDASASSGSLTIGENNITGSGQDGGNCTGTVKNMGVEIGGSNSQITNNLIYSNGGAGVIVSGSGNGNLISQNSFYANGTSGQALGIDLNADGVTLNDSGDSDSGPNDLTNFPIISFVTISGSNLLVRGWARPGTIIEFFFTDINQGTATGGDNELGLSTDYGEGQLYIATATEGSGSDLDASTSTYSDVDGNTDNTNRFEFLLPLPGSTAIGSMITATGTLSNTTSEFSPFSIIKVASVITNRRITYRVNKN